MSKELLQIPGVGKSIMVDIEELGFETIASLKGADPEKMYEDFCDLKGQGIDRCLLYVFRCTVYYASSTERDPEKLKWWNWKD